MATIERQGGCLDLLPTELWVRILQQIDCQRTYENVRLVSRDLYQIWHDPRVKDEALVKFTTKIERRSPKGKVRVAHVMPNGKIHGSERTSKKHRGARKCHRAFWIKGVKDGLEEWSTTKFGVTAISHEVSWSNGRKCGIEKWIDSAPIRELPWRNDRRHGTETRYDRLGNVIQLIEWRNNKRHGKETRFTSGLLMYEITWSRNKRHGNEIWYDLTGTTLMIREWKLNQPGPFVNV